VGHDWFKYLKINKINFCFRIPKHHHIACFDEYMNEKVYFASDLQVQYLNGIILKDYFVSGVCDNVYVGTDKKVLLLFGTFVPKILLKYYEMSWTIEPIF
jgi:hypothetical protein